ncbi:MAG: RNA 2',3'-cyclic phosphodiesterase [Candidatus Coatesbacteria bacterium]|nr:RNA 2',3'-cyclic phosphodiesterase [Candidatus Coatesbacteria bacterium]
MTAILPLGSGKASGIRAFISIEIPKPIREQMIGVPEPLKEVKGKFSWSSTNNLHITLKFLGDCTRRRLEAISKRLSEIAASHMQFGISFEGVGVFPSFSAPRIVWLGIKDGREQLVKLANDISDSMEAIGFKKEAKPFRPHITLARIKYLGSKPEFKTAVGEISNTKISPMAAKYIFLMRSQLNPKGAIYTVIERMCLADPAGTREGAVPIGGSLPKE